MDELFQTARAALTHVYWLGGPGCSGKSSVARLLGSKYDLRVYHVDDEMQTYELDPNLRAARWRDYDFSGKNGKAIFHLPAQDVADFVIDDWQTTIFVETVGHLLALPYDKRIIVEGVFLPETLLHVAARDRIAVMVSNRAFREHYFDHRYEWFAEYDDKEAAFHTALDALDIMDQIWTRQSEHTHVHMLKTNSLQDIQAATGEVFDHFWSKR